MCRLFGISRQGLYQSKARANRRSQEFDQVRELVCQIRRRQPRLGTRKLYYLLKSEFERLGIKLGRDALFDYLRAERMLIKPRKKYTKTTYSKHWLHKHPNLVKDLQIERAEQLFVSDITYLKSRHKTYYLSLVTDAYSRKIMGYYLSEDMFSESIVRALQMAVRHRRTKKRLIHHSDRGLQYCSAIYQNELAENKIKPSMTDGSDCYQNALAERVNGILKQEFLLYECNTTQELERLVKESIEIYNNERPHLSLGMQTPNSIHEKACGSKSTGIKTNQ